MLVNNIVDAPPLFALSQKVKITSSDVLYGGDNPKRRFLYAGGCCSKYEAITLILETTINPPVLAPAQNQNMLK